MRRGRTLKPSPLKNFRDRANVASIGEGTVNVPLRPHVSEPSKPYRRDPTDRMPWVDSGQGFFIAPGLEALRLVRCSVPPDHSEGERNDELRDAGSKWPGGFFVGHRL